jgi:hypothetical protein
VEGTWKGRALFVVLAVVTVAVAVAGGLIAAMPGGSEVFGTALLILATLNAVGLGRVATFMWTGRA